jgi:hypothetical protein
MGQSKEQQKDREQMQEENSWKSWWFRNRAKAKRERQSRAVTNLGDQFGDILRAVKPGFTFIEALIIVVILCAVLSIIAYGCGVDSEKTKAQARQFVGELGYAEIIGVSCSTHDSDGDGYISCSVRVKDADKVEMLAIECAGGLHGFYKSGCRQPKFSINRNRN